MVGLVIDLLLESVRFSNIFIDGLFFMCESSFNVNLGVIFFIFFLLSIIFFKNCVFILVVGVVFGRVL